MSRGTRVSTANQAVIRRVEVNLIEDIGPRMRRIVLTGEDLSGVLSAGGTPLTKMHSTGFDDRVMIILPLPGQTEPELPEQLDGRIGQWPHDRPPIRRAYTVREWNAARAELTLDFVLHGHGPAAVWASQCRRGQTLHILGPGISYAPPVGTEWVLLVGDETALPAIARWLDDTDTGLPTEVIIEVDSPNDELPLASPPNVNLTWVHRHGVPAQTSSLLEESVRAWSRPEGPGFVWVAGESSVVRPIRRHLLTELNLPREQVQVEGYWKAPRPAETSAEYSSPGQLARVQDAAHDDHDDESSEGLAVALTDLGVFADRQSVTILGQSSAHLSDELTVVVPSLEIRAGTQSHMPLPEPGLSYGDDAAVVLMIDDHDGADVQGVTDVLEPGTRLIICADHDTAPPHLPSALKLRSSHSLDWVGQAWVYEVEASR